MKLGKILIIVILAAVGIGAVFYHFFISMSSLPQGELLTAVRCDGCGKTVNIYLVDGGATTDYAIRGETVYDNGHTLNVDKNRYDRRRE